MKIEKVVRDGKVAVLVSPGFGAGWSTWADPKHREFALFDAGLVALAEAKAPEEKVIDYIAETLGKDAYFYTGGWRDIEIEWVRMGAKFIIVEYDGSETLQVLEDMPYYTA